MKKTVTLPEADFKQRPPVPAAKSRGPRIRWHADGLTVDGVTSLRLNNIPKNLRTMAQSFSALGNKTRLVALWALSQISKAKACIAFDDDTYATLYLNHTSGDGFLAVKYTAGNLPLLNNPCHFTSAQPQRGLYELLACPCQNVSTNASAVTLYGQNLNQSWLDCMETFLNTHCYPATDSPQDVPLIQRVFLISIFLLCCTMGSCVSVSVMLNRFREENTQREIKKSRDHSDSYHPLQDQAADPPDSSCEYKCECDCQPFRDALARHGRTIYQWLLDLDKKSFLIGALSAYGTGAIKGAQLYSSLKLFQIATGSDLPIEVRLTVLPLIPLINMTPLHYTQNKKIFQELTSWRKYYKAMRDQWRIHPVPTTLISLAAITEGMMVTNSVLALLKDNSTEAIVFSAVLGVIDALQFILLDGKALADRMDGQFIYTSKGYRKYSDRFPYKARLASLGIHSIPTIGAMLYTALAFIETRELIEQLMPSDNVDYRYDIGSIFGLLLSLIYGAMQYGLYGYQTQQVLIDWLAPPNFGSEEAKTEHKESPPKTCATGRKGLAWTGAFAETLTLFVPLVKFCENWIGDDPQWTGENAQPILLAILLFISVAVGFTQNYVVEGYEIMGLTPEEKPEDPAKPRRLERGGGRYRLPDFLNGIGHITALTLWRTLIQRILMPDTATADSMTWSTTLASYVLSGTASLATWRGFESLRRRTPVWPVEFQSPELRDEKQRQEALRRQSVDSEDSNTLIEGLTPAERNSYEARQHSKTQADQEFRNSRSRLVLQSVVRFLMAALVGTFMENGFRQLFTRHSHLDPEESLNNGQILGALFTGLLTVIVSYAIDWRWGLKDRRLLERFEQKDKPEQKTGGQGPSASTSSGAALDSKHEKEIELISIHGYQTLPVKKKSPQTSMAEGLEGYDFDTFYQLIHGLNSDSKKGVSTQTTKIIGLLRFSEELKGTRDLERKREYSDVRLSHAMDLNLALYDLEGPQPQINLDNIVSLLTAEIAELSNRSALIIPYSFAFNRSSEEEYGFLQIIKDDKDTVTATIFHPTNDRLPRYFLTQFIDRLAESFTVKRRELETRDPFSTIDSGPWVVMQIEAVLRKKIDLNKSPFSLVREPNLSAARLSQFSFLARLSHSKSAGAVSSAESLSLN
jgi:hypothetical protein